MQKNKLAVSIALVQSFNDQNSPAQFETELNLSEPDGQSGFVINGVNAKQGFQTNN